MPELILTLKKSREEKLAIPAPDLGLEEHRPLAREIQIRLIALGVLDPPDDGLFGPVSRAALALFRKEAGIPAAQAIDAPLAEALLKLDSDEIFPVIPGNDLAGRIVRAMASEGHWFARAPGHRNIVYVERIDEDGGVNDNKPNQWNDLRAILVIEKKKPKLIGRWQATTEPGTYYTKNPLEGPAVKYGTARIAFGQYKAWRRGTHIDHEALVQVEEIRIHRDKNKDYEREGDTVYVGSGFAVNQHWGYDYPSNDIGRASAGCLVGRTKKGHQEFMEIVKGDPRYQASNGYRFFTTILDGRTLPA